MSPAANIFGTLVRMCSSVTIWPLGSIFTPTSSRPMPRVLSVRPIATSTSSEYSSSPLGQRALHLSVRLYLHARYAAAALHSDTTLLKRRLHRVRYLRVVQRRHQVRHHLHDGHVHAVDVVDVTVLKPDGAGADDHDALRQRAREVHYLVRSYDLLVVHVERRNLRRARCPLQPQCSPQ